MTYCYILLIIIGEPGLLVGKIRKTTINSFNGYVEKSATEKKIIRDVFYKGDEVFNSGNFYKNIFYVLNIIHLIITYFNIIYFKIPIGDVLIRDEYNFYYFKDRTGDTFRYSLNILLFYT